MKWFIRSVLVTFLAYLLQVCLLGFLPIEGVKANLIAINIAVLTVSYGRKYAIGASCLSGLLLEVMTSNIPLFNLAVYSAFGSIFCFFFSDMSDQQRERARIRGKRTKDLNPHLRILLNTFFISLFIELTWFVYIMISGGELSFYLIWRIIISLIYTEALCFVYMFVERWMLGMAPRRIRRAVRVTEDNTSE